MEQTPYLFITVTLVKEIEMSKMPMKLTQRLEAMRGRHRTLDLRIRDELSRPKPDGLRLQTLKRLKLRTKDQMAMIAQSLGGTRGPDTPQAA